MFDFDEYEVYTSSSTTLINRLLDENVKVLSYKPKENKIIIRLLATDREKIIVLFDKLCYNYKIVKSVNMRAIRDALKRRFVLVLGIICTLTMFALIPTYIYRVEIDADATFYDDISGLLSKCNIRKFTKVKDVDCVSLKNMLNGIDGVSFADVEIVGSTLKISIKSALEDETFYFAGTEPIVSETYAVITRQIAFSGTLAKNVGDRVTEGDVLIYPYILVGDSEVSSTASGEVYGIKEYSVTIPYNGYTESYVRSGKISTQRIISFLGIKNAEKSSPYEMYDTVTKYQTAGVLVPVEIKEITYFEIVKNVRYESFSTAQGRLQNEALNLAYDCVPDTSRIMNTEVNVREADGIHYVTAKVYCEVRIDATH